MTSNVPETPWLRPGTVQFTGLIVIFMISLIICFWFGVIVRHMVSTYAHNRAARELWALLQDIFESDTRTWAESEEGSPEPSASTTDIV